MIAPFLGIRLLVITIISGWALWPNDYIQQSLVGTNIISMDSPFTDPDPTNNRLYYMGAIDGSTPYGDIIGAGPVGSFSTPPTVPAADAGRRSLSGMVVR